MIRLGRLKTLKRWRINGILLPDEIDYLIIYGGNNIREIEELTEISRVNIYRRIKSMTKHLMEGRYENVEPMVKTTIMRYDPEILKLFMVSTLIGLITDEDIAKDISKRFREVVLDGIWRDKESPKQGKENNS